VWAVCKMGFREALATPLTYLLLATFASSILMTPSLVLFGFGDSARIVRETGIATLRLAALSFVLMNLVGGRRVPWVTFLSRPGHPSTMLVGRYLGTFAAISTALAMLSVVLYGTLKASRVDTSQMARASAGVLLETALTLAFATATSVMLPRGPAAAALGAGYLLSRQSLLGRCLLPLDGPPFAALLCTVALLAFGAALFEHDPTRNDTA